MRFIAKYGISFNEERKVCTLSCVSQTFAGSNCRQPTEGKRPKSSNLKGNRRKAAQKATTVAKEAGRQDATPIPNAGDLIIPKDTGNSIAFLRKRSLPH